VRGLTLAKAKARIRNANCSPGRVTRAYSRMKAGLVISQKPAAGTRLMRTRTVSLVVSRGRKPK
jgi:beta-lactam-binding protein with PASTA domain